MGELAVRDAPMRLLRTYVYGERYAIAHSIEIVESKPGY
jgi:hypothetical protein